MSLRLVAATAVLAISAILVTAGPALADAVYVPNDWGDLTQPDLPAKTVVLTFDDGPSGYTPQVLNILREKHVKATFFVVGEEAVSHPLLARIYSDGHEIGNHTYTHADLTNQPWWRRLVELNLTRIVVESQTRHATRIFRPPYLGSDDIPLGAMDVINQAGNLGYITAGENLDTEDWSRPGVRWIEHAAETPTGGIILMHDGGGDRSQTIAALPHIIDYYRDHGYRFATLSGALGVSRDQLMPSLTAPGQALASVALVVFTVFDWLSRAVGLLCLVLIAASFIRAVIVTAAALTQSRRRTRPTSPARPPSVSVIIPAYNEARVIQSCLRSILATTYPNLEVIVVDDGSTDRTAAAARAVSDKRVQVLAKPNGGKARALNFGIRHSRGHFIVAIDADTAFRPDTISRLIRRFTDPHVGAVSGNTKIVNRRNLITKLQSLEYVIGFNLDRRMGDLFDCITVVPGAVGAFRRTALYDVNGFSPDTLAEDTDLTLQIKEAGYKIVYEDLAIAYTEAPAGVRELLKQRYRWTFGTMQAVFKHRRSLFNPRAGTLGLVGLPYLLFYQIIFPLLGPLFDLTLLVGLLTGQYHLVAVAFLVYSVLDFGTSAVAFRLDHEKLSQLWILLPQRVFYRQLMYYVIARSTLNVLKGKLVNWDKLKREGLHLPEGAETAVR